MLKLSTRPSFSPKRMGKRGSEDSENISTSVGSNDKTKQQIMLPRDHKMTKEQLIMKVHKDMQCVLEILPGNHDKLGNGYKSFIMVMKKVNQ